MEGSGLIPFSLSLSLYGRSGNQIKNIMKCCHYHSFQLARRAMQGKGNEIPIFNSFHLKLYFSLAVKQRVVQ
jgi:hypothetical protein